MRPTVNFRSGGRHLVALRVLLRGRSGDDVTVSLREVSLPGDALPPRPDERGFTRPNFCRGGVPWFVHGPSHG
jgi:hypothetical protein